MTDDFAEEAHRRLYVAFMEAARHKRKTKDECVFEMNLFINLELLYYDIMHGLYHPRPGIAFVIEDPVIREIFAASFRDRIIHHFVFDLVSPWWDTRLCYDAYSCRKGKGTLFGVKRMVTHIRKASRNYARTVYVAKFDLQGYFMSLPRKGLFERVLWGLDRQYPNGGPMYLLLKYLWREIIFDDPIAGVRRKGNVELWKKLPKTKSLFNQPPGIGIVIGNLSSQLLSNIYLDPFDRFVQNTLGYKHYGRYVDDFYIVVTEEELNKLKADVNILDLKLSDMRLTLHPRKRYIQEAHKGTKFLGTVVYPGRVVPEKRIRRNFYSSLKKFEVGEGQMESITSYLGLMKHYNSKKILAKIFDSLGQEYRF